MPAPLLAIAAGVQAAIGVGQAIYGGIKGRKARKEADEARDKLASIKYSDENQRYFSDLTNRSKYGLEDSQRQYLEQGADSAAGMALNQAGDRRAGLMGIGASQQRLSDSYRQIGQMDVSERLRKEEERLAELNKRGEISYQEKQDIGNLDLSLARGERQEMNKLSQVGIQNSFGGLSNYAWGAEGGSLGGGQNNRNPNSLFGTSQHESLRID